MTLYVRNLTTEDVVIEVDGVSVSIPASAIIPVNDLFAPYFNPEQIAFIDEAIIEAGRFSNVITTLTALPGPPTSGDTDFTDSNNTAYYWFI